MRKSLDYRALWNNNKSNEAELITTARKIILDELPMMNRYAIEALDRTLKDIMGSFDKKYENILFGGKILDFGSNFRQILSKIRKIFIIIKFTLLII